MSTHEGSFAPPSGDRRFAGRASRFVGRILAALGQTVYAGDAEPG